MFNTSPSQQVILGENGWLFYDSKTDGVTMLDYYGRACFSSDELVSVKTNLLRLKDAFGKRNICFFIVLAPNKQSIYPEFLPERIRKQKGKITRADQLCGLCTEVNVDFIDLCYPLLKAKKGHSFELYHKLGTHWNQLGGFIAYETIIDRIKTRFPAINKLNLSQFIIRHKSASSDAGCASMMGMKGLITDNNIELQSIKPLNNTLGPEDYSRGTKECDLKNIAGPYLLVFRDSFSSALLRYLSDSFSRSVYLWRFHVNFSVIDTEKPDIVILEFAERYSGILVRPQKQNPEN